jgi:hypothetical protein
MRRSKFKKSMTVVIIILFIGVGITPTIGISNSIDDTTPPVTTITFNPPTPNGENGWYVTDVNVTLNATDDLSGVKAIFYKIPGDDWKNHSGDSIKILLDYDCLIGIIEFYSVDNNGNQEPINSYEIYIDQEKPEVDLRYEVNSIGPVFGWEYIFTATADDDCSGLDRAEYYLNGTLQETIIGSGPKYKWYYNSTPQSPFFVYGIIFYPRISEDFITFFAIMVLIGGSSPNPLRNKTINVFVYDIAGNCGKDKVFWPSHYEPIIPGIYRFEKLTLPNNYQGHLGLFFIDAKFFE